MDHSLLLHGAMRRARRCATVLFASCMPVVGRAQTSCATYDATAPRPEAARVWSAPLDRRVSVRGRELSLRDAVDRTAAAAHLRLSYQTELLPLDRRVCIAFDSVTVGDALSELLAGTVVTPVSIGGDQVVLAPTTSAASARTSSRGVNVLERVVVTGSATGEPRRSLAVALNVLDREQIAEHGTGTLSQLVNGAVPGVWLWEQSPASLIARYGSIRGASSFGVTYPKVYIDGIEVANSLLVTSLSPDVVDRVEVIRGPQGAALYGADAISGVVNIVTRHDGAEDGEHMQLRSAAGAAHSDFASRPVLVQEQTLNIRSGSSLRSAGLSVAGGSVGSFIPGARSWELRGNGDFRVVGARSTVTGTARIYSKNAGAADNPLAIVGPAGGASGTDQAVRQYTLGTTATVSGGERWTHTATVGLDGYRLSNVAVELTAIPSAADSALRAASGASDRATLRASSVGRFGGGPGDRVGTTVTIGAEHSALRERTASDDMVEGGQQRSDDYIGWRSNTGILGQIDLAMRDDLFFTGGLRLEHNDGLIDRGQLATLPMAGASFVRELGVVTTKLRAAYGKGIRPPRTPVRELWYGRQPVWQRTLAPEEQSGVEGGVDAFVGRTLALHVTRFDQRAFGLIQPVIVTDAATGGPGPSGTRRLPIELQNVGEITNRGWELESALAAGRLAVSGTLSLVESRVRRASPDYTGELRPGDRMLGVPARTVGIAAAWTARRWFASVNGTRASDWINYDGIALSAAYGSSTQPGRTLAGANLRAYWRAYPGVTRLEATFGRDLLSGLSLVLNGRNLLDAQRGEPDNVTVVPGRTITAAIRARF